MRQNAKAAHELVKYLIYDKVMRRSGVCVSVRACVYACACVSVNIVRLVRDPDLGGGAVGNSFLIRLSLVFLETMTKVYLEALSFLGCNFPLLFSNLH